MEAWRPPLFRRPRAAACPARGACSPRSATTGWSTRSGAATRPPSRSSTTATTAGSSRSAATCSAPREEAEDAVQQTFTSAYTDLQSTSRDIRLKAWLYTIARNRCLSILRARREQPAELDEQATAGLSEEVQQRADLRELLADLRDLPDEQREALVLFELGDLSQAEIAGVIGVEPMKVKALVFQARSALIENREARAIPCAEIREQLATASGGALRRGPLRRHLQGLRGLQRVPRPGARPAQRPRARAAGGPQRRPQGRVLGAIGFGGGAGGGGVATGGAAGGAVGGGALRRRRGRRRLFAAIAGAGGIKLAVAATLAGGALAARRRGGRAERRRLRPGTG